MTFIPKIRSIFFIKSAKIGNDFLQFRRFLKALKTVFPCLIYRENQVTELKLSNFDILLIENRKLANVSSTNGDLYLFILDLI